MGKFKDYVTEQKQTNATPVKVTCARCAGSGRYSFNLIHGDKCYGCGGKGFVMSTVGKEKAKAKRLEKKEAEAKVKAAERAEKAKQQEITQEQLYKKYADDPRIGDHVKKEMKTNGEWKDSVVNLLNAIDNGQVYAGWKDVPDHWKPRYYHDVKFKDKESAKKEGMIFDRDVSKWYHLDKDKSKKSAFPKIDL